MDDDGSDDFVDLDAVRAREDHDPGEDGPDGPVAERIEEARSEIRSLARAWGMGFAFTAVYLWRAGRFARNYLVMALAGLRAEAESRLSGDGDDDRRTGFWG